MNYNFRKPYKLCKNVCDYRKFFLVWIHFALVSEQKRKKIFVSSTLEILGVERRSPVRLKSQSEIFLAFAYRCSTASRFILSSKTITNRKEVPFATLIHFPNITFLKNEKKCSVSRKEYLEINKLVLYILYQVYSADELKRTYNWQNYALLLYVSKRERERIAFKSRKVHITSNPCGSLSK